MTGPGRRSHRGAVLAVSVTEAGRRLAARLPFEHVHGDAAGTVRRRWPEVDGLVLFLATGAAVRLVGPLLGDKRTDPGVVCVDEAGRWAVALSGGHAGGANALATRVAALLGADPVVTTATDAAGVAALDALPGFVAAGDVAAVTAALLDGRPVAVDNPLGWPLPPRFGHGGPPGPTEVTEPRLVVTDRAHLPGTAATGAGVVVLHPPSLVAGVGASTGAPAGEADALLQAALDDAGLARASVAMVATLDRKAGEPAVVGLGLPVRAFPAAALAEVDVPTGSEAVRAAVGTPSVAEAAALVAAGPGAELVVPKRRSANATVAVARRRRPPGHLAVVGLGPGAARHRTPAAETAVRRAEVVIGYGPYVDQCADLLGPAQEVVRSPIGEEAVRAKQAVAEAAAGRRVALVCSGDAGVYGMASLACELAGEDAPGLDLEVVPGVSAGLAAAALLGAPLGHDHAVVSLSDLRTPWTTIATRLRAAAAADLAVVLYNPRSQGRPWQLDAARAILAEHRAPTTPVGVVTAAARPAQAVLLTTLGDLDPAEVGMASTVVVGSSATRVVGGRIVTPRGHRP